MFSLIQLCVTFHNRQDIQYDKEPLSGPHFKSYERLFIESMLFLCCTWKGGALSQGVVVGKQPSEPAHPGNLSLSDITGIFKPQLGLTRRSIKVNYFQTSKSVDVLIVGRTFYLI